MIGRKSSYVIRLFRTTGDQNSIDWPRSGRRGTAEGWSAWFDAAFVPGEVDGRKGFRRGTPSLTLIVVPRYRKSRQTTRRQTRWTTKRYGLAFGSRCART